MIYPINIKADTFTATIDLNALPMQLLSKIRKLFKLIFSHSYENAEAIQKTEDWFTFAVKNTKQKWQEASADYQNKWVFIDPHGYTIPAAKQQKINRPLIMAVKHAKANYERMLKIQASFLKYKGEI